MKIGVVITAGGTGSRFSAQDNKLFVPLKGKPILYHACMAFSALSQVTDVVITYHPKDLKLVTGLLTLFPSDFKPRLVPGGDPRCVYF